MMNALEAFAPTIHADQPTHRPDLLVSFKELNQLMGEATLDAIENKFVSKS
jgi:hypothetical protein